MLDWERNGRANLAVQSSKPLRQHGMFDYVLYSYLRRGMLIDLRNTFPALIALQDKVPYAWW